MRLRTSSVESNYAAHYATILVLIFGILENASLALPNKVSSRHASPDVSANFGASATTRKVQVLDPGLQTVLSVREGPGPKTDSNEGEDVPSEAAGRRARALTEAATQEDRAISIVEWAFDFFAVVLAIVSVLITVTIYVFIFWLSRSVRGAEKIATEAVKTANGAKKLVESSRREFGEDYKRLEGNIGKEIESLNEIRSVTTSNILLSADLALMNLRPITYAQQIPIALMRSIERLERIFIVEDKKGEIWNELMRSEKVVKICYARGIYHLGLHPENIEVPVGNLGQAARNGNVIALFEIAGGKTTSEEISLKRDILVRLSQAYRQVPDLEKARKVAKRLGALCGQGDTQAAIYINWIDAIIDLQEGFFTDNLIKRRDLFRHAAGKMVWVYGRVFGWRSEKTEGKPAYFSTCNANIAYYTAKALWSYHLTVLLDGAGFNDEFKEKIKTRLEDSIDMALRLFLDEKEKYIADPCIAAIYNYCIALMLTVRVASTMDITPRKPSDQEVDWFLRYRDDPNYFPKLRAECLEMAKTGVASLMIAGSISSIYVEHEEKFSNLLMFEKDVNLLEKAIANKDVLVRFYRKQRLDLVDDDMLIS